MEDNFIVTYNVRCKSAGTNVDFSFHCLDEIIPKTFYRKSRGFCVNDRCKFGETGYSLNSAHNNAFKTKPLVYVTDDHKEVSCPHCTHSLFWTSKWNRSQS